MQTQVILAAEYTNGTNKCPPCLYINRIENGRRSNISAYTVTGKREARKLAAILGATPWNF